jgi:hypothetical protein
LIAYVPNDDMHGAAEGVRIDLRNPKAFLTAEAVRSDV